MKLNKIFFSLIWIIILFNSPIFSVVIEEIYAVVNDEIITYSEIKTTEMELIRVLRRQYRDERLQQEIEKLRKGLVTTLIEQKLILSKAKEKNYDIDQRIEIYIKEIMKKNNINTEEELKEALASEGLEFNEWKDQLKKMQIQQQLIFEEIGSKIVVGNDEIMAYYKKNKQQFTKPSEISLNCIFLNKTNYLDEAGIQERANQISSELTGNNFIEIAKKYSELPGTENKHFLGVFKKGELNKTLEDEALKLKKGERSSSWMKTDNGWYIIQLVNITEPQMIEYKEVRNKIDETIRQTKHHAELKKFIEKLKKESYIKIFKEYK